jgi:hypothetical protein
MTARVIAAPDAALGARIVRSVPMLYAEGADEALDRPAHVRAGSGLARAGGRLVVIQDDANFLALVDPGSGRADSVPLPAGPGRRRQFDEGRGNKHYKLDLEACVVVPGAGGDLLVALGSGSSPRREQVAVVRGLPGTSPEVTLYDASAVYAELRAAGDFVGSEMNVEGAVFVDGRVRLFQRGNGAPVGDARPVSATCELDWETLYAHLRAPHAAPPPKPTSIVQYELGTVSGLPLGFTDATLAGSALLFSAAAEDSPDATRDGEVAGSVLGVLGANEARWTLLRDDSGDRFAGKVEGVLVDGERPRRAYVVVDSDDAHVPSMLCEVELTGRWG